VENLKAMMTIHQAAEEIRQGRLAPMELLDSCLAQIDRYEPRVQAWVFVDRDGAKAQCEQLTKELSRGHYRGPLHGIPLGIKDIYDVFDWPTAAGSRLWAQSIARRDAAVVSRHRQAGAVFVGKTTTTQYASFDPSPTRNPWNLGRTPGGSSSGSAAALACRMCLGALGSQTGGSITRPASYCGVAGFKPTFGRVSCDGVVPLASSMDHPGPMANSVRDLAIILQAIAGYDPRDPASAALPVPDYIAPLHKKRTPPRLARVRGHFQDKASVDVLRMMDQVSERFQQEGAVVTEVALPAGFGTVLASHRTVMAVESAAFHRERLRRHPDDYLPEIRKLLEEGLACSAAEYARCKEHQKQLTHDMAACFEGVDAILAPATTEAAPDIRSTGNPAFNSPWSYTGLPVVSMPAAYDKDGMPLAIQFAGPAWSEADLLAVSAWCEAALALEARLPPG
jgi:Asp-tRNA(Asn)/Glu-tRNA(Gln) amidotransferase A subunit family amidase